MYKRSIQGGVIRKTDNATIPESMENSDWRAYQHWLASGNTPDPAQSTEEIEAEKWTAIAARRDRYAAEHAQDAVEAQVGKDAGYAETTSSRLDGGANVQEHPAQDAGQQAVNSAASGMFPAVVARFQRDQLIDALQWRIARYRRQTAAAVATDDTAAAYSVLMACVQVLRDTPI